MRFPQSAHLLMLLSLETLMLITRTGLPVLKELIDLANSVMSNDLTQMVNFPTRIPDLDSHSLAFLDLFFFSDASICSTMAFPSLGDSDHTVASVSIIFRMECLVSLHCLWLFLCWLERSLWWFERCSMGG